MNPLPASVLVIESHPMMREALCTAIAAEPDLIVVDQAVDGAEEMLMVIPLLPDAILLSVKPDIILLALGNPGLEELEALAVLRACLPGTPVLALTSNEVEGQEQAALDGGACLALTKAAPRAELIRALQELRAKAMSDLSKTLSKKEAGGKISS
jgi:DNA-binding NarL/FixJ family response regulator